MALLITERRTQKGHERLWVSLGLDGNLGAVYKALNCSADLTVFFGDDQVMVRAALGAETV